MTEIYLHWYFMDISNHVSILKIKWVVVNGSGLNREEVGWAYYKIRHPKEGLKDGASFCYCAYVLRISGCPGYSCFLRNLPTNTTVFLCCL